MPKYRSYSSLIKALKGAGLTGQQSNPHQLIVSIQTGPVWPGAGNSFCLSHENRTWYLSTWLPAWYRIPPEQDLIALCIACMKSGTSAMYRVPEAMAAQFKLERLSEREIQKLFPTLDCD